MGGFSHGMYHTTEYKIWSGMIQRCTNRNSKDFHHYGGRGIKIYRKWKLFVNFYADMGPRPSPKHTLDRKNNDGNYTPKNCRWATQKEQHNNVRKRKDSRWITYAGETLTAMEWCRKLGMSKFTLSSRLNKHKWSVERALTTPVNKP